MSSGSSRAATGAVTASTTASPGATAIAPESKSSAATRAALEARCARSRALKRMSAPRAARNAERGIDQRFRQAFAGHQRQAGGAARAEALAQHARQQARPRPRSEGVLSAAIAKRPPQPAVDRAVPVQHVVHRGAGSGAEQARRAREIIASGSFPARAARGEAIHHGSLPAIRPQHPALAGGAVEKRKDRRGRAGQRAARADGVEIGHGRSGCRRSADDCRCRCGSRASHRNRSGSGRRHARSIHKAKPGCRLRPAAPRKPSPAMPAPTTCTRRCAHSRP